MALQKDKTLPNGSSGNYWKITSESYDKVSRQCEWRISLFLNKDTSDSKKPSLGLVKSFSYLASKEELAGDRTALGYTQIKSQASRMINPPFGRLGDSQVQLDPDLCDTSDV